MPAPSGTWRCPAILSKISCTWLTARTRCQQNFLYVADGENSLIHILRRDTLDILTAFGEGGRQPGQWHGVHNIATDSQGNIYTTETYEGKRIQKFTYKGLGPVTKQYQGTPWPASASTSTSSFRCDGARREPERRFCPDALPSRHSVAHLTRT